MDLKLCVFTINLISAISCLNLANLPKPCLDCFDPNEDADLTKFFEHNSEICSEFDTDNRTNTSVVNSFTVKSYIKSRYATTYVSKSVTNHDKKIQEVEFLTYIPVTAFITTFIVEIDAEIHKSKINKRDFAPKVELKRSQQQLRKFHIKTKLNPKSTVVYHLLYEDLLKRENNRYEVNLNVNPGEILRNLYVEVAIKDHRPIENVRVPVLMLPQDEVDNDNEKLKPKARIGIKNKYSVSIRFHPSVEEQKRLIKALGSKIENGLNAQFRVFYNVKRTENGGELLTHGPYFVHYFAPKNQKPLPKHVIFVLDVSSSMEGKRINQLKQAMKQILQQLKPEDLFNIIQFHTTVSVADIKDKSIFQEVIPYGFTGNYEYLAGILQKKQLPGAVKAEKSNVNKAIKIIDGLQSKGATNVIGALQLALSIVKQTQKIYKDKYEPIIIFLTDGEPTIGIEDQDKIIEIVTKFNGNLASIFSIGIGDGLSFAFLKRLSALNKGASLSIKNDGDISELLQEFFDEYSSPVLSDIRFNYGTNLTAVTETHFPTFFDGAELIVAGKFDDVDLLPRVTAKAEKGHVVFKPKQIKSSTPLERLWSYLIIGQNLDDLDTRGIFKSQLDYTTNLALKYSRVTPLTSMKLTLPGPITIDDYSILTSAYRFVEDVRNVSVNVNPDEIQQIILSVELLKTPGTEIVQQLTDTIKNAFMKILTQAFNKM